MSESPKPSTPFKIVRKVDPVGMGWVWPAPHLVGIQPLTTIRERRFELIERAQELARERENGFKESEDT